MKSKKEIALEIAVGLQKAFDPELLEDIIRIDEFIKPISSPPLICSQSFGKYIIPESVSFEWNYKSDIEDINDFYNNEDTKKEMYETLSECLRVIRGVCKANDVSPVELRNQKPRVVLSEKEFEYVKKALHKYAHNQLMGSWESHGYGRVNTTNVSDNIGMKVWIHDNILHIKYMSAEYTYKEKTLMNTSQLIPFCVAMLHKLYNNSKKLIESN